MTPQTALVILKRPERRSSLHEQAARVLEQHARAKGWLQ